MSIFVSSSNHHSSLDLQIKVLLTVSHSASTIKSLFSNMHFDQRVVERSTVDEMWCVGETNLDTIKLGAVDRSTIQF